MKRTTLVGVDAVDWAESNGIEPLWTQNGPVSLAQARGLVRDDGADLHIAIYELDDLDGAITGPNELAERTLDLDALPEGCLWLEDIAWTQAKRWGRKSTVAV